VIARNNLEAIKRLIVVPLNLAEREARPGASGRVRRLDPNRKATKKNRFVEFDRLDSPLSGGHKLGL
jgi:hypothetical protein